MTHLSGRRLLSGAAVLVLILAALLWRRPWQSPESSASSRDPFRKSGASASVDSPPAAAGSSRRPRPSEKVIAEAKLRSLLESREGEVSLLRLPPETMKRLKSIPPERPLALSIDAGTPSVVGIYRPESLIGALTAEVGGGMPVEGQTARSNNDLLSWSHERWSVDLTPLLGETSMALQLSMKEGPGELVTTFDADFGSIVLLSSTEPEAEGLLIVVGKGDSAESPSSSRKPTRESP